MFKEELYIGGQVIDLTEDAKVLVNKRLFDIDNPEVRAYDFTKSIKAAGSKSNNILFGQIFKTNLSIQNTTTTNFTPDFNPNLKAEALYYVNSVLIMEGTAQMIDIVINNDKVEYNLNLFGKQIDLFETLGESKLNELDFNAYDHTYNYTNISGSWALTYTNGYVYPMVDYAHKQDYNDWNDFDFKPAIYDWVVINKLLDTAGYTYTSAFLDSARFKNYIMPFSLESITMSSSTIEDERFKVSLTTLPTNIVFPLNNIVNSSLPLIVFDDDSGGDLTNTSGNDFDTTTGKYDPQATYTQRFKLNMDFKIKYVNTNAQGNISINKYGAFGEVYYRALFAVMIDDGTTVTRVGTVKSTQLTVDAVGWVQNSVDGLISTNDLSDEISLQYTTPEVTVRSTDKVYVVLDSVGQDRDIYPFVTPFPYVGALDVSNDWECQIEDISFEEVISNPSINIGDTIPMSDTLPDYTQRDYLMDLVKQHNLIIDIDPLNPTNLLIEPMVDYYTNDVNDLTSNLVNDNDFVIQPMGYLQGKKYILSYAKGEGDKNKEYQDEFKRIYGDFELDVNNDFQTETKRVDTKLIPTPSVGVPSSNNRVIPYLRDEKDKPRRLYWGGLLSCSSYTILENGVTTYTRTDYPYAGHLDDPYTPTLDLSFGTPKMLFWDNTYPNTPQINYTNNNLHAEYWYNYLQEITDKDSKVVEAYFYMTPYDVYKLNFTDLILVKNTYYRLIQMYDYDRTQPITKLKLLKTQYVTPITITTGIANGGSGGLGTWDRLPTLKALPPTNGLITQGDDPSKIQGNTQLISGTNNLTAKGVSGGGLINCNDRVLKTDEVWINNVNAIQKATITIPSLSLLEMGTVGISVIPSVGTGRYIDIVSLTGFYDYGTAPYGLAYQLILQTDTTNTHLATLPVTLYNTGVDTYKKGAVIYAANVDMGEGIELITTASPAGGDGDITLTIYYRIVEI